MRSQNLGIKPVPPQVRHLTLSPQPVPTQCGQSSPSSSFLLPLHHAQFSSTFPSSQSGHVTDCLISGGYGYSSSSSSPCSSSSSGSSSSGSSPCRSSSPSSGLSPSSRASSSS